MPIDSLQHEEARVVFEVLAKADFDTGAGRDFHYSLVLKDGATVSGLLVEKTEDDVTLVDVTGGANTHNTINWTDVASIGVTGFV